MKTTIKTEDWSEDIRWRDIWRAHVITGLHEKKNGSSKLRGLIKKQIALGKVRQTARGTYQFRIGLVMVATLALLLTGNAASAFHYRQHRSYWVDCGPYLSVPADRNVYGDTERCHGVGCGDD